jgi:NitT/TauT family transport system substrate-binding protein
MVDWVTNEVVTLQVRGVDVHTFLFSDYKYEIFNDAYFATENTIAAHPDVLSSFVAAERQGWQEDITSPDAGVQLTISNYGKALNLDVKQQQLENTAQLTLMQTIYTKAHGLFSLDPTTLQQSIETLSVANIQTTVDDLFTTTILDRLG